MNEPTDKDKFLREYNGLDQIVLMEEAAKRSMASGGLSFKTGLPYLDSLIDGVQTGEVIVVSGPTKNGKTTLCETISHHIKKAGANVLWFSFEVPVRQFIKKYGAEIPQFYTPAQLTSRNLQWLEEKVHEAKVKHHIAAVFIDHLHFIVDMADLKANSSIVIGQVMRYLKQDIAIKHGVAVFLVAHMAKTKIDKKPDVSDLRDSSFIAQEADSTLIVWREPGDTNKAKIIVCNHRRTGVMEKSVKISKQGNFLFEEDNQSDRDEGDDRASVSGGSRRSGVKVSSSPRFQSEWRGD